jgi:hypothetical protein
MKIEKLRSKKIIGQKKCFFSKAVPEICKLIKKKNKEKLLDKKRKLSSSFLFDVPVEGEGRGLSC